MFKNLTIARFSGLPSIGEAEALAQAIQFAPTQPTQQRCVGFVPPREANGALIEAQAGHWIMAMQIETRAVPPATLKKRVEEMAAAIERDTGHKPGKKTRRDLKDQAMQELLPKAFPKSKRVLVWLDTATGLLAVDTASSGVFDTVTMLLATAFTTGQHQQLTLSPVHTTASPAGCMAAWLLNEPPLAFTIDRECELKSADELKSVVRYARHPLDTDEVRQHIEAGKRPTKLAMTWRGRASFVLTGDLVLRKAELLDEAVVAATREEQADAFDADVAIFTGAARELLADLIDALGGEVEPLEGGAA